MKQEPGDNGTEIMNSLKYVRPGDGFVPKFELTERTNVNGADEHPMFTYLKVWEMKISCAHLVWKTVKHINSQLNQKSRFNCLLLSVNVSCCLAVICEEIASSLRGDEGERHQVELRKVPSGSSRETRHQIQRDLSSRRHQGWHTAPSYGTDIMLDKQCTR